MPDDRQGQSSGHTLVGDETQGIKGGDVQDAPGLARDSVRLAFDLLAVNRQQPVPQRDLSGQKATDAGLNRFFFVAGRLRLPPRQAEGFGQGEQEIPLADAFAVQHGIDKGSLIEARIIDGLPDGRPITTTRRCEDLFDERKHNL